MNEILKKRIEEAGIEGCKHYDPNVSMYSQGKQVGYLRGFNEGAEYALSHQWISVEEALPKYDEAVIVRNCNGEIFFCHRSNRIGVETDDDKWCNYTGAKIVLWMPTPEFETKK